MNEETTGPVTWTPFTLGDVRDAPPFDLAKAMEQTIARIYNNDRTLHPR